MKYESIGDILSASAKIRQRLLAVLDEVSPDEAVIKPDSETWSIQEIVEHLSIVDAGTARICSKLLDDAKVGAKASDGSFALSPDLIAKTAKASEMKITAPERVRPTGDVAIADSLKQMKANGSILQSIYADLEKIDSSENKFPHPFLGDISAPEWLVVAGGHEMRHTKQIERQLELLRK